MDENNNILVIKRDGQKEPFAEENITKVTMSTGLSREKSQEIAQGVKNWLNENNKKEVSSLEIRDKVLNLLHGTDENAENLFRWYQSTKKE